MDTIAQHTKANLILKALNLKSLRMILVLISLIPTNERIISIGEVVGTLIIREVELF
jgi:hypothetical protein